MGGTNEAFGAANEAIGHPEWAKDRRGAPIYSAGNYLNIVGPALRLDTTHSVPLPSSLEAPSWGCVAERDNIEPTFRVPAVRIDYDYMEPTGIEPVTSCLQSRRSPS
jgi:hypothetical protein